MINLSNQAVNRLRHNARCMVRELGLLNDAYFDIGVTLAERHLLIELSESAPLTMKEIAERFLLDKSTVSRLIAKAAKKGYITCTADQKDRRKRLLQMTDLGKATLNAFEPIAFEQTKQALLRLKPADVELVFQGVALYAQGLKLSRQGPLNPEVVAVESFAEITAQLAANEIVLRPFIAADENDLYMIFSDTVNRGGQFYFDCDSREEFHRQFFIKNQPNYVLEHRNGNIVAGFFLRPNNSGRAQHIANAGYMVHKHYQKRGYGTLLLKASLHLAKNAGFRAMQFNLVLSQNQSAVNLYRKAGFQIIGTIPEAVLNPDGSYQDGYIMHRSLTNI